MDQLMSLTIICSDVDECLNMLQRSPHVIHCAFKYNSVSTADLDPAHAHWHASQLEVLEFFDECEILNEAVNVVLENLTAPAIRKISWHVHRADDLPKTYLYYHEFVSFIYRSSCSLESFSIFFQIIF